MKPLVLNVDHLERCVRRMLQEVFTTATADYWLRRGDEFAQIPTATAQATAHACRAHAALLRAGWFDEPWPGFNTDLDGVLAEKEVTPHGVAA